MVGFYNYTVIATYFGFLSALAGGFLASRGFLNQAVLCLAFCGIIDSVDGAIARTKKNRTISEKRFGIEIDSLSDMCAFGILPAYILFNIRISFTSAVVGCLYGLSALIRLSFFDVLAHESIQDKGGKHGYVGLPVTSSAWLIPAVFCFRSFLSDTILWYFCLALLIILGILFLAPFHLKKPGIWLTISGIILSAVIFFFLLVKCFY